MLLIFQTSAIFAGFTGSSAALAVTRRAARLFTDGRYRTQAAAEVQGAQVEIVTGPPAVAAVQWLAAQPGVESAGFDPTHTTVAELSRLRAELPSKLRRTFPHPARRAARRTLRLIKDEDELKFMREAHSSAASSSNTSSPSSAPAFAKSKSPPNSNTRPACTAPRA